MNLLSVLRIEYKFTVFIKNLVRIHFKFPKFTMNYLFRESTMNPLFFFANLLFIYFREFNMNSQSLSRIHQELTWCFRNSLPISRSYFEFTFYFRILLWFANILWIYLMFREHTMNSLDVSRIHYQFTVFIVNLVRIPVMFRWFSEFSWCLANILRIHYLVCEFTINLLSCSRIYYFFTIFIVDSSRNHLVFREFTMNSIYISRFHCKFIRCFPNILLIV